MTHNPKPIITLAELCQKKFGANIITRVVSKTGPDHMPVITVEIKLPNGAVYTASGSNQKIARQNAADQALAEMFHNVS